MEIRERQEQFELQRQRNATITKAQPIPQAIFLVKSHNVFPDAVILTSFIYQSNIILYNLVVMG